MFFSVRLVFLELGFVDAGEETDALEESVHHLRFVLGKELFSREYGRLGRKFSHSLNSEKKVIRNVE